MMELPVGIRLTNNRVVGKVAMCQKQARPSFRITDYLSKWIECLKIEASLPICRPNALSNQSDNRYINNLSLGISQTANAPNA